MERKKDWIAYPMEQSNSFIYALKEMEEQYDAGKSNWKIMDWEGEEILYGTWTDNSRVLYGAWFRLSDFLKDITESLPWNNVQVEAVDIYAQDLVDSTEQTSMLKFSSESKNVRVNTVVSRSELMS